MAEYSLEFSQKLIETSKLLYEKDPDTIEAQRVIIYLCSLSCEITLKAILEKVGVPVKKIINKGHKLTELLKDVCKCEIYESIQGTKQSKWVAASRLRSKRVSNEYRDATIGRILGNLKTTSKYPNEIRYGDKLIHYPLGVFVEVPVILIAWARKYWDIIRIVQS